MATPNPEELTVDSNKEYNKTVESKKEYAFTMTFKRLNCKTPRGQFYETAPYLTKILERSTLFSLMPEWRHTTGDIHYHGILKIYDLVKWIKSTLPTLKSLGYLLLKPIKEGYKEGWKEYYNKELIIAEGILPSVPFPIESRIHKVVNKFDLKTYSVMDDYILECLNSPKK